MLLLVATLAAALAQGPPAADAESIDLRRLPDLADFHARSPWRLTASQGPPTEDYGGNPAPGLLTLCLRRGVSGACETGATTPAQKADWSPHYLRDAAVVSSGGRDGAPLLKLVTASLHAGDGGQIVTTMLLRYRKSDDAFRRVFTQAVGTNNNQEVRWMAQGPLRGAVVAAEPTSDAPYGYWISVSRAGRDGLYRPVLRYRSATRYDDGDPLPVIDSDMPGLLRRLGLWRRGDPPPLPVDHPCPAPRLKGEQLWCGAAAASAGSPASAPPARPARP